MSSKYFLQDECDKTIHPDVLPVYEKLKISVAQKLATQPDVTAWDVEYVRINGKKVTCILYLSNLGDGKVDEQFEYLTYHYFHQKTV